MDNRKPTQAARVLHFMARYGSITKLEVTMLDRLISKGADD